MHQETDTPMGKVIIVCAGKSGMEAFDFFGEENVVCFADNSPQKQGSEICGKKVIPLSGIGEILKDMNGPCDVIVALTGVSYYSGIFVVVQQIMDLGIMNYSIWEDVRDRWPERDAFLLRDRNAHPFEHRSTYKAAEEYVLRAYPKADEYEKKWAEIQSQYKKVIIHKFPVDILGDMLSRYFVMLEENKESDVLYVKLPVLSNGAKGLANKYLADYIGICSTEEALFWLYIIDKYPFLIDDSKIEKYIFRTGMPAIFCKANSIEPHFTEEQKEFGERTMRQMNIAGKFVCLSARSDRYNRIWLPRFKEEGYNYRNSEFGDYKKTIEYLETQGIQTVKMGRFEDKIEPIRNCVDYAGMYANDFLDLYLFSKCKFAITGCNGINTIPMLFAKPLMVINATPITILFGGARYTEYDLFIPKKYYDVHKRRYLTFLEIFEFEKTMNVSCPDFGHDIVLQNNTEDEILDATKELMARIDGTWIDTGSDISAHKRWCELFKIMDDYQRDNNSNWLGSDGKVIGGNGGAIPFRPAATFLRKYSFMLD